MEPRSPLSPGKGAAECSRPDLALKLSSGEEVSGAFGEAIGAHAKGCSECSLRLSLLQQAERWLAEQATSNRGHVPPSTPCPSAEELFDFGRGVGAQAMALAVERRIEAHLVECAECRGLVATLASRPPAPLLGGIDAPGAETARPRPRTLPAAAPEVRRPTRRRLWLQVAAAAALLVAALYWLESDRTSRGKERDQLASSQSDGITYPQATLLRGDSADALYYPRARLLAALPAGTPGTLNPLRFEIAPQPGASRYTIQLSRVGEGAFDPAEGLGKESSTEPMFDWPTANTAALQPGHYIWEAWAEINGLGTSLGRRSFEIVESPEAREELAKCERLPLPERASAAMLWLVDHEFSTDARAYARNLPASPARDAFLESVPGR